MLRLDAARGVTFCDGLTRRDFLHAGAIGTLGLTLPGFFAQRTRGAGAGGPGARCGLAAGTQEAYRPICRIYPKFWHKAWSRATLCR